MALRAVEEQIEQVLLLAGRGLVDQRGIELRLAFEEGRVEGLNEGAGRRKGGRLLPSGGARIDGERVGGRLVDAVGPSGGVDQGPVERARSLPTGGGPR